LPNDIRSRFDAANRRATAEWRAIHSRAEWEKFRDAKLQALRASLGQSIKPPAPVPTRVTRRIDGAGYRIENLLYESRPGLWVTANLYLPAEKLSRPSNEAGLRALACPLS